MSSYSYEELTREGLIYKLVESIVQQEGKVGKADRRYLLELVAEVRQAVDGDRHKDAMNISPKALKKI